MRYNVTSGKTLVNQKPAPTGRSSVAQGEAQRNPGEQRIRTRIMTASALTAFRKKLTASWRQ